MKKLGRYTSVISRDFASERDSSNNSNWVSEYEKALTDKSATTSNQQSLYDQISSIMGNQNPKFSSVQEKVKEMQERSGLNAYKALMAQKEQENSVKHSTAQSAEENVLPEVIKERPYIKSTIENYINTTHGTLPIPAIIEKVKNIHRFDVSNDVLWNDPELAKFINKLLIEAKKSNPTQYNEHTNLGSSYQYNDTDVDPSNVDAFHGLTPVK